MKKNSILTKLILAAFAVFFCDLQNAVAQNNKTEESKVSETDNQITDQKLTLDKVDSSRFSNVAIVQGLNKITAKSSPIEIRIGDTVKFGQLSITALKCWQAPLEQKPESKILLEIYDNNSASENKEQKKTRIFYGWMFASSPSISTLEHPIYDITAIGCKNR